MSLSSTVADGGPVVPLDEGSLKTICVQVAAFSVIPYLDNVGLVELPRSSHYCTDPMETKVAFSRGSAGEGNMVRTFYDVACECDLQKVHNICTDGCRTAREQLNSATQNGLNLPEKVRCEAIPFHKEYRTVSCLPEHKFIPERMRRVSRGMQLRQLSRNCLPE